MDYICKSNLKYITAKPETPNMVDKNKYVYEMILLLEKQEIIKVFIRTISSAINCKINYRKLVVRINVCLNV